MSSSVAQQRPPEVRDLEHWIALAARLIETGHGDRTYSGMTLTQWQSVLCAENELYIVKKLAVAAVKGVFVCLCREKLGRASDGFIISVEVIGSDD